MPRFFPILLALGGCAHIVPPPGPPFIDEACQTRASQQRLSEASHTEAPSTLRTNFGAFFPQPARNMPREAYASLWVEVGSHGKPKACALRASNEELARLCAKFVESIPWVVPAHEQDGGRGFSYRCDFGVCRLEDARRGVCLPAFSELPLPPPCTAPYVQTGVGTGGIAPKPLEDLDYRLRAYSPPKIRSGKAVLEVVIQSDGTVTSTCTRSASMNDFARGCAAMLQGSRFRPAQDAKGNNIPFVTSFSCQFGH